MSDIFKIYIDRLTKERMEKIAFSSDCSFLDIHEAELQFADPIDVKGEAYLTKEHLIIHLKIHTAASLLCKICNGPACKEIILDNFYHAEPLENIKRGIYDYSVKLREAVLLEVPAFLECNNGNCPQRTELKEYFTENTMQASKKESRHFPFKNLQQE
ncbi:MAG: hypothetical protein Tsb0015_04210 [Simkaniaceae bacterium]